MKNNTLDQILNSNLASVDPGFYQFALAKASSDLFKRIINKCTTQQGRGLSVFHPQLPPHLHHPTPPLPHHAAHGKGGRYGRIPLGFRPYRPPCYRKGSVK